MTPQTDATRSERTMGTLESTVMRVACRLWGHQWIELSGDVDGQQCMRCWEARDVAWSRKPASDPG